MMAPLSVFTGFVIGRVGHCYINVWLKNSRWVLHHWIYGAALMIAGVFVWEKGDLGIFLFSFGLGVFVSDLKDFLHFRFITPDPDGKKRFWHID